MTHKGEGVLLAGRTLDVKFEVLLKWNSLEILLFLRITNTLFY